MQLKIIQKIGKSLQGSDFLQLWQTNLLMYPIRNEWLFACDGWIITLRLMRNLLGCMKLIPSMLVHCSYRDVLVWLNLSITKARGQCYNGAAAMPGCRSGVAKRIIDDESKAIYTHCYGHPLDLAITDTVKRWDCINIAFSITHEITKLIKISPQREARFLYL